MSCVGSGSSLVTYTFRDWLIQLTESNPPYHSSFVGIKAQFGFYLAHFLPNNLTFQIVIMAGYGGFGGYGGGGPPPPQQQYGQPPQGYGQPPQGYGQPGKYSYGARLVLI